MSCATISSRALLAPARRGAPLRRCPRRGGAPSRRARACASTPAAAFELRADGLYESWEFKGWRVNYALCAATAAEDAKPPVVLVHGFGGAVGHFRSNIAALAAAGHDVYAVDLLGLGRSEKPKVQYEIELWAEQLAAFAEDVVGERCVVVGNSLGSLSSLCAVADRPELFAGWVGFNCAGGLNNKAILSDSDATDVDWRLALAGPIFSLLDYVLKIRPVASYLFDKVRTPEAVSNALQAVYVNPSRADDELVQIICKCAEDEGALDAFVAILTGPGGPKPQQCLARVPEEMPLCLLWGTEDTITPDDGPVGQMFQALPEARPNTQYVKLPANHCPFDDAPEASNRALIAWLDTLPGGK